MPFENLVPKGAKSPTATATATASGGGAVAAAAAAAEALAVVVAVAGCPVLYCTCVLAYLVSGTHAHVGPGQISGNLGTWKSRNLDYLKIQICSAQNVGKVWISRKKTAGPLWYHFSPSFHGPEKYNK